MGGTLRGVPPISVEGLAESTFGGELAIIGMRLDTTELGRGTNG
jgi:hypothetical protein